MKAYNTNKNSSLDKAPNKLSHTTEKKINYTLYQSPDYMKLWRNREKNIDGVIKCLLGVIETITDKFVKNT